MGAYASLKDRKILVVEDVELNQYLARHIMESWGCHVQIAENGALAIEKINNNDFDLVLMDIQMPVMDGIQATRQIRELDDIEKASVPIVALTANATRSDFDMYLKAGMNDCLPKPFEEPALFQTVTKNIRKTEAMPPQAAVSSKTQTSPVAAEKSYDLTMVEAISGGDKSFVVKMLNLFLETVPATLDEMCTHRDQQRWPELSKIAHKLKSTIDSMGITDLKQTIRNIEANAKTGKNTEGLTILVDTVLETMKRVMAQVKKDHAL